MPQNMQLLPRYRGMTDQVDFFRIHDMDASHVLGFRHVLESNVYCVEPRMPPLVLQDRKCAHRGRVDTSRTRCVSASLMSWSTLLALLDLLDYSVLCLMLCN